MTRKQAGTMATFDTYTTGDGNQKAKAGTTAGSGHVRCTRTARSRAGALAAAVTSAAMILGSSATPLAAAGPSCGPGGYVSQFESADAGRGFQFVQEKRGEVRAFKDPKDGGNGVAYMEASKKRGNVSKSALVLRFPPVPRGTEIEMGAEFYFPNGAALDSVILMDLECASCGPDTNPGVRLYLRDGRLRVDRSKIGVKEPFYPKKATQLTHDAWHEIVWRVRVGDQEGTSEVYLDGELVGQDSGTTVLTQRIVDTLADLKVREQVDRFQVGLTANSNNRATVMLVDDVWFCVNGEPGA